MVDIDHEIKIQASPEKVFKALSDVQDLKAWHTAHIQPKAGMDHVLVFNAAEKPEFLWKVMEIEPDKEITWKCIEGPGNSSGTEVIYKISKTNDHRTLVEMKHAHWPHQEGNFRKCNTLWGILLHHLKTYLETGKPDPAIR